MTLPLAIGCTATPEPIDRWHVEEVTRDLYVQVDDDLTEQQEVAKLPPREEWDSWTGEGKLIHLGVLYWHNTTRLEQCNNDKAQIAELEGTPVD